MKKMISVFAALCAMLISGCTVTIPVTDGEKTEELEELGETDWEPGEVREYVVPAGVWSIAGLPIEEQVESFMEGNDGQYYTRVTANEDDSISFFMTEEQYRRYLNRQKEQIEENVKEFKIKDDIEIQISGDYREIKLIMGEKSDVYGFRMSYVIVGTDVGLYQSFLGGAPEDWSLHIIAIRDGEVLLDVNEPDEGWTLTNEDFGE